MTVTIGRRELLAALGGAAAWPLAARAQQSAIPVIGFLNSGSHEERTYLLSAFSQGLSETGHIEGRNVAIDYRWAQGQYDRLPAMAAELVRRPVAVIAATGDAVSPLAAKAATTTIPIVFVVGGDPVALGLVTSFNRPAGNITGVNVVSSTLGPKALELLHELVPSAAVIGILLNPTTSRGGFDLLELQKAARAIGVQLTVVRGNSESSIEAAFTSLAEQKARALLVEPDVYFLDRREQLVALSARDALPVLYSRREYAAIGGLASYGANLADGYRQAGIYAGRILKGEKPADLPVMQPTKFDLVLNLKTAKALHVEIPDKLLALADEVIECVRSSRSADRSDDRPKRCLGLRKTTRSS